jgi:ATP-dependent DNA ligase
MLNSVNALRNLSQLPLPGKHAWHVGKMLKQVQEELQEFEETRKKIIERHDEDSKESVTQELQEILDEEVEIDVKPLPLSVLEECQLTGGDMMTLEWLIDAEDE